MKRGGEEACLGSSSVSVWVVVGGETLMMPQDRCQQDPSQQAEGNMSASEEAIRLPSSCRCTAALQKRGDGAGLAHDDKSPSG